jgi:hypothetical protein
MPLRSALFLAGWCLFSGCLLTGDEDLYGVFDDVLPRVIETFPQDGWEQVPTGVDVRIWFSEAVDPVSVHRGSIILISGDDLAEGSFEVSADGLVVLRPLQPLIPGVTYRLAVTTWVTDLYGNPLENGLEIGFVTLR